MASQQPDQCFVVMPFGSKPLNDGSGRLYDFDKVYRVIIQRAVRQAGLEPVRADERKVSDIIHADMFKNLRDRAVVLADLSLENPNVFYELGARHVMSAKGTILMCRSGSELPFDVKLSRVIFYDFDGSHLDWEEVERVVRELQFALEEAKRGTPDSPVHALLERVLPEDAAALNRVAGGSVGADGIRAGESLDEYQRIVAEHWSQEDRATEELLGVCGYSVFGCRALGLLALSRETPCDQLSAVARRLYDLSQFDLAGRLYERLDAAGALSVADLLAYGSTLSERRADLAAADDGLAQMYRAAEILAPLLDEESPSMATLVDAFACHYKIAGLCRWRWQASRDEEDLAEAVEHYGRAMEIGRRLDETADDFEIGRLAACHLDLLLLLRIRDDNLERGDVERHREQILGLKTDGSHSPVEESYARWLQAIALADGGDAEGSNHMAMRAFSEDAKVMDEPGCEAIGRKQYVLLRRYLEHYSGVLHHPSLIGHISQVLQIGHRGRGGS
ncbi:MAG TPA: hypothetical protein VJ787_12165 [Thermoleophilia bacterium]|nr:hypothetical protein [Thermoleophilia bacterium]